MKEIGGYFELDQLVKNEYYKNLISLNSGRNALLYLLKAKNIKRLHIPYFLCNSVSDMLKRNNFDFNYYCIDNEFNPIISGNIQKYEYLYIVNYYGQLTDKKINLLKSSFERIIIDNTHAFFQKPIKGIDTIYSCRKFFGVPDGAYLATDCVLDGDLEIDVSKDRMTHILGRFEGKASDYYSDFKENDMCFKNAPLKKMSKLAKNILGAIDYENVIQTRNENYKYLENNFKKYNKLKLIIPNGPFAYPMYIEDGMNVKKMLLENKVYIPTLWPNVLRNAPKSSVEYDYSTNVLPLPCDQRNNVEDMKKIVNLLKNY
ncbi:hypothetical protein RBH29_04310 [Herbivorax sp. ANBcel31]|uniref:hypothetical protein n=1 Tax=Herbivorax sp. ANBcel31 TaxID=3069754 RepID=UPI0027B66891|nr:hypothetical protein [Herbivorax sp. ANBcel31]MDQ2085656.1 hypothetical protein [Herbivorax sp. ANBcel31]